MALEAKEYAILSALYKCGEEGCDIKTLSEISRVPLHQLKRKLEKLHNAKYVKKRGDRYAISKLGRRMLDRWDIHGLPLTYMVVLWLMYKNDKMRRSDIAHALGTTPSNAYIYLKTLMDRGWIKKCEDNKYAITEEGKNVVEALNLSNLNLNITLPNKKERNYIKKDNLVRYKILNILAAANGLRMSEIAKKLNRPPSSISTLITRMRREGLIEKRDTNPPLYFITEKGMSLLTSYKTENEEKEEEDI